MICLMVWTISSFVKSFECPILQHYVHISCGIVKANLNKIGEDSVYFQKKNNHSASPSCLVSQKELIDSYK